MASAASAAGRDGGARRPSQGRGGSTLPLRTATRRPVCVTRVIQSSDVSHRYKEVSARVLLKVSQDTRGDWYLLCWPLADSTVRPVIKQHHVSYVNGPGAGEQSYAAMMRRGCTAHITQTFTRVGGSSMDMVYEVRVRPPPSSRARSTLAANVTAKTASHMFKKNGGTQHGGQLAMACVMELRGPGLPEADAAGGGRDGGGGSGGGGGSCGGSCPHGPRCGCVAPCACDGDVASWPVVARVHTTMVGVSAPGRPAKVLPQLSALLAPPFRSGPEPERSIEAAAVMDGLDSGRPTCAAALDPGATKALRAEALRASEHLPGRRRRRPRSATERGGERGDGPVGAGKAPTRGAGSGAGSMSSGGSSLVPLPPGTDATDPNAYLYRTTVRYSDEDMNRHANHASYAAFVEDALEAASLSGFLDDVVGTPRVGHKVAQRLSMTLEYAREVHAGDHLRIHVRKKAAEDGVPLPECAVSALIVAHREGMPPFVSLRALVVMFPAWAGYSRM